LAQAAVNPAAAMLDTGQTSYSLRKPKRMMLCKVFVGWKKHFNKWQTFLPLAPFGYCFHHLIWCKPAWASTAKAHAALPRCSSEASSFPACSASGFVTFRLNVLDPISMSLRWWIR
jgi:hypothetical protein